ncbi:MAG: class I SAM-dependent RNA methyltransferase [Casimicrobiaceae bacterium]
MTERFFAPCPRGLEAGLGDELTRLGAQFVAPVEGGVAFSGPLDLAYRTNLESRLASRVLWQVAHGGYRNEDDVYDLVRKVRWTEHFRADRTLRVDVAATRSPLTSLEFATLRVKDAVCDVFRDAQGTRPSVDKQRPDVRVHAYLTTREATIYLDTSGEPLFKRGYRRETDTAPLRENLAAGIVALSGWTPGMPFLDPMCGSGTIAIEAAMIAADRAPGLARTFGFQRLGWYDGPTWQRIRQAAHDRVRRDPDTPLLVASDREETAVRQAGRNAAEAGVGKWILAERADVLTRAAPATVGILIANPPYGVRLEDARDLAAFYPQLGDALKQHFTGWTALLLSGDLRLPKLIGLKPSARTPLWNGAIECRLFRFEMVAGRPRRDGHAATAAPVEGDPPR